jgi:hypothetical protein
VQKARGDDAPAAPAAGGVTLAAQPAAGLVSGEAKTIDGSTLYVADASGNTVKVTTSTGTAFTKAEDAEAKAVCPGDTVTVTGTRDTAGTVEATRVVVGDLGALGLGGGPGARLRLGPGGFGDTAPRPLLDCLRERGIQPGGGLDPGDPDVRAAIHACRGAAGGG